MTRPKGRLGLGDFLGSGAANFEGSLTDTSPEIVHTLPTHALIRGSYQTRHIRSDDPKVQALANSIRQWGIIEPLVVRPHGRVYEILAGERRWRAAQVVGLAQVPVVVQVVDDRQAAAITLVENLQREDLNPMEEAEGLARLQQDFALEQQHLAELLGCSQSRISRSLGLLQLAAPVQNHLRQGTLQAGHAKPLLGLEPGVQIRLADQAAQGNWSVRELERQRERLLAVQPRSPKAPDPDMERLKTRLQAHLGTSAQLRFDTRRHKGKIEIPFASLAQCQGILARLGVDIAEE